MHELQLIEHNHKRVLTTSLLAENYGADEKQIHDNFANNKSRYIEGVHYYCLQGDELRAFKSCPENADIVGKNAPVLYLWTEKGALLHAKSLNTEEAWNVYMRLIDDYFRVAAVQVRDSYMIEDPVERAQRWIAETKEKQALALQVEEQKVKIEEQQTIIVEQHDTIEEQKDTIDVQSEEIKTMSPKAAYCDLILNSPGLMAVSEIANDYGMTANKFNKKLSELGIQYNANGVWTLLSKYDNQGYTRVKPVSGGNGKAKNRTYWTHKGRIFLYKILKENGILPKAEQ